MNRWSPVAYLAIAVASTALATVQPEQVPEAEVLAWLDAGSADAGGPAAPQSAALSVLAATPAANTAPVQAASARGAEPAHRHAHTAPR